MKLPNSYGSVIKLAGQRRKKYAVRISAGHKQRICVPNKVEYFPIIEKYKMEFQKKKNCYAIYDENDEVKTGLDEVGIPYRIEFVRKYKYLEYFEKSKDAYAYLAQYNRGEEVKEHASKSSEPTFEAVFDAYIEFAKSLKKPPSEDTLRSYQTGFNNWKDVHDLKFKSVTTMQLQKCISKHSDLSKTSIGKMMTVLKRMYKFALAHRLCNEDLSPYIFLEYSTERKHIHTVFSDEEVKMLWKHQDETAAQVILTLIYTGMRCSEFLEMKTEDVHLDERYMVGGLKTDAGRNRIIPIHKSILPVVKRLYDAHNAYLYPSEMGNSRGYQRFRDQKWSIWMEQYGMKHYTHDCRHTCATWLEAAGVPLLHRKLILGHTIRDITDGTYTHVAKETLIEDMDKMRQNTALDGTLL